MHIHMCVFVSCARVAGLCVFMCLCMCVRARVRARLLFKRLFSARAYPSKPRPPHHVGDGQFGINGSRLGIHDASRRQRGGRQRSVGTSTQTKPEVQRSRRGSPKRKEELQSMRSSAVGRATIGSGRRKRRRKRKQGEAGFVGRRRHTSKAEGQRSRRTSVQAEGSGEGSNASGNGQRSFGASRRRGGVECCS